MVFNGKLIFVTCPCFCLMINQIELTADYNLQVLNWWTGEVEQKFVNYFKYKRNRANRFHANSLRLIVLIISVYFEASFSHLKIPPGINS